MGDVQTPNLREERTKPLCFLENPTFAVEGMGKAERKKKSKKAGRGKKGEAYHTRI